MNGIFSSLGIKQDKHGWYVEQKTEEEKTKKTNRQYFKTKEEAICYRKKITDSNPMLKEIADVFFND